jgi:hypothetical protein
MIPHLIHIGFPKAGSTFLQNWFAAHPQIQYGEGGIAGFRDVWALARRAADTSPPRCLVTSAEGLATPHRFVGLQEIDYAAIRGDQLPDAQAAACRMLAELFPHAHILIVTRGFRSIMPSSYSQYVRTGGTRDFPTFSGGVEADDDPMARTWDYDRIVRLYRGTFGDRLIVLPYELLRDDSVGFVRLIEDRLGLDHHPPPRGRANESLSPVELGWYPRISRLIRRLPVGAALRDRIHARYVRAAMANRLKPVIQLLQRIRPLEPITIDSIGSDAITRFRGRAEALRGDPLYAPYRDDYLL